MNIEFPEGAEYNLDMQIAHVIVEGIPNLRGTGYPPSVTPEKWDEILTDIEEGFRHYRDCSYETEFCWEKFTKALNLLKEWFCTLWW